MSFEKEIKLVEELCMTPGISGHEEKIAEIIKRELKDVADDIETDLMGNVIATKKGSSKKGPKVMLAAHMDEIGLMVRYIDDNGYIKFSTIGGINDQMLMNQTVVIHSKNGDLTGVIGSKPPHVTKPEEKATVYGVGTTQEEVGLKGAKVTSYKLNPDMAFALDVTLSGDHPGIKPEEAPVVIGKGPAVIMIDASGRGIITPKIIRDLLIGTGHLTREGIPTGVLSVPTRYIHTTVSVASMEDVENTIQLIVAAINSLE